MSAAEPGGETVIEALTHEGAGVAHHEGKALFLEGGLPGERVRFQYDRRKRHYDRGRVTAVLCASAERTDPPCAYFGVCGGCRLQHLDTDAQVRAKEQAVRETLRHVGQVEAESWAAPLTGPVENYRRRARLGVRLVPKKGGVLVGFRERNHSFITPLDRCLTLEARISERLPALRDLIASLAAAPRVPQVEYAGAEGRAALVFRHLDPLSVADAERIAAFGRDYGFDVYGQEAGPETVHALGAAGPLSYAHPAFGVRLGFAPTDFVQVNDAVNRAMVEQALSWLAPDATTRVLDLFCGLGNFSLPLARCAQAVVGIEGSGALVERAQQNAADNGIMNATFLCADLDGVRVREVLNAIPCDAALLDPPRTGAQAVVEALGARGIARLLYVSCNPATLARDAGVLVHEHDYRLARVGVLDMFPHTHHIECMALFEQGLA